MRLKNLEITYWPYAKGFIRVYGKGSVVGLGSGFCRGVNWFDWVLFLTKIRVVKLGNPQHKTNLTDYNISVCDAAKKLLNQKPNKY